MVINFGRLSLVSDINFAVGISVKLCVKCLCGAFRAKLCVDCPIFLGNKCADFTLAVNNNFYGNRLYSAGGKTASYLFPKKWTELISNKSVKYAASLLRVNKVDINLSRRRHTVFYAGFCNFVESYTVFRVNIKSKHLSQMPRNSFTLSVRVGCKQNCVRFGGLLLKLFDKLVFCVYVYILRFKTVIYVNSKL